MIRRWGWPPTVLVGEAGAPATPSCLQPSPAPSQAQEAELVLRQGPQLPGSHTVVVLLDPGTDLHLRLGEEALVLAPQAALHLAFGSVVVVLVPARVPARSELLFPTHARLLRPRGADTTRKISLDDGSLSVRRAQRAGAEGAAPGRLGAPAFGPLRRAPSSCGPCPGRPPRPRAAPGRPGCALCRPNSAAEFRLDLRRLRPCPGSALRPLPPSLSPGPGTCRAAYPWPGGPEATLLRGRSPSTHPAILNCHGPFGGLGGDPWVGGGNLPYAPCASFGADFTYRGGTGLLGGGVGWFPVAGIEPRPPR